MPTRTGEYETNPWYELDIAAQQRLHTFFRKRPDLLKLVNRYHHTSFARLEVVKHLFQGSLRIG